MRAVPGAMVKKNIHANIGNKVDVCPGYEEYGRRRWHSKGGRRGNRYLNIDIYFGHRSM
jgi:hypothetical protein